MAINLNREGVALNAEERNKRNQNWVTIEQEVAGIGSNIADLDQASSGAVGEINKLKVETAEQKEGLTAVNTRVDNVVIEAGEAIFDKVIDASKLEWQEPVATFADLATTYPDATEAFTSQTTSDGSVYRFNGSEWKKIQQVDAGPINEVDTRLTAQLADKAGQDEVDQLKIAKQIDFVSDLQAVSDFRTMNLQITASALYKFFSVNILSGNDKGVQYTFGKTYDDDYMMLMKGSTGNTVPISAVTRSANWESRDNETLTNPPNNYTTIVGDKLHFTFTGSKISFTSMRDIRGGLWKATLNAGTAGEQTKLISVYSATTIAESEQIVFENLNPQKHVLVMEFMGQDTANPVASPRGWYYTGGALEQHVKRTFNVYNDTFTITPTSDIMFGSSFKEAIVEVRPLGSTEPAQYVPVHNTIGTAFNIVDTKILADGKPVVWNVGNYYHDVKVVQIIQRLHGFHPSDMVNPLFELTQYHTVKNGVVKISGKYKFLRDTEVTKASAMNITYYADVVDKIITSIGNSYDTINDGTYSAEYWEEADRAKSFAFISKDETNADRSNTALAATIDNFDSTFRVGEENRGDPFSWIEHRSATMGKIYFRTMVNGVKYMGDEMKFDGRYMVTLLPGVNEFIS